MSIAALIRQSLPAAESSEQPVALPAPSSRRSRLWELPSHVHCPVIGVCLSLAELRQLATRAVPRLAALNDYDLHSAAVQLARTRGPLAEALQAALDRRHATAITRLRKLRDPAALLAHWQDAVALGELAPALWAVLTHPASDLMLADQLSQQMHMIQHQAGASLRLDVSRLHRLEDENTRLAGELEESRLRGERQQRERSQQLARLEADLHAARSALAGRDAELAELRKTLALYESRHPHTQLPRLQQQLEWLQQRNARLELEAAALRRERESLPPPPAAAPQPAPVAAETPAAREDLGGSRILCVGGRDAAIPVYRRLIEEAGGAFDHHDGGQANRFAQLDHALSAADMVICQTGCISHNAYWRVKEHCKRTGKRCAFVDTPSSNGLARGLQDLLAPTREETQPGAQP